jgi:hypothetical protein
MTARIPPYSERPTLDAAVARCKWPVRVTGWESGAICIAWLEAMTPPTNVGQYWEAHIEWHDTPAEATRAYLALVASLEAQE